MLNILEQMIHDYFRKLIFLTAFLAVSFFAAKNAQAALTFEPKVDYATEAVNSQPLSVKAADFDNDGNTDIVVANQSMASISVFFNNGDGTFGGRTEYATANGPRQIAVGDFNHDGSIDLAVVNNTGGSISVFINNGSGIFAPKVDYATGWNTTGVAVGDFNGDSYDDLAVARYGGDYGSVYIFINNGDGTFAAGVNYDVAIGTEAIAVGDFNHDGHPDLVSLNQDVISVLFNNGDGTFVWNADYASATGIFAADSIVTGDFNGDGKVDIANADGNNAVAVFLNNGTGTFAAKVDYFAGSHPYGLALGDLDGDGKIDIATANYTAGNTVSVLLGAGDGTFGAAENFVAGWGAYSVAISDLNSDGKLDLAVANHNDDTVSILLGIISAPVVTTDAATSISRTSATVNMTISETGGNNPSGLIEWGTAPGTYTLGHCDIAVGPAGSHSCNLTGLTPNTVYYYRAKATNSAGTTLGSELSFMTHVYSEEIVTKDFIGGGVAKNWNADDDGWIYDLPFTFNFYGTDYTQIKIGSNGVICLDTSLNCTWFPETIGEAFGPFIVAMGKDLDTTAGDIYITENSDNVIVRWQAVELGQVDPLNFEIVLYKNGEIKLNYGDNAALTGNAVVGVSRGDGSTYTASAYNGLNVFNQVNSSLWTDASGEVTPPAPDADGTPNQEDVEDKDCKPTKLRATALSASQIKLDWKENCGVEDGFRIERKTEGGDYKKVKNVSKGTEKYTDEGLVAGTTYIYRVRAYKKDGHSDYSNKAEATTLKNKEKAAADSQKSENFSENPSAPASTTGNTETADQNESGQGGNDEQQVGKNPGERSESIAQKIEGFSQQPGVQETSVVVAIVGLLTGAAVASAASASSAVPLFPTSPDPFAGGISRFFSFFGVLGRSKKKDDWGVVFDSETRRPIRGVVVSIINKDGRVADSNATDSEGRYGFLAKEGTYSLRVSKDKHELTKDEKADEFYGKLYTGESFEIKPGEMVTLNIAMSTDSINWKEFAQRKIAAYTSFFSVVKKDIFVILFYVGFFASAAITYFSPTLINGSIVVIYVALAAYRIFFKTKSFGTITNDAKKPVPFATVSLYDEKTPERRIAFAVSDVIGRYYLLAKDGFYLMKIQGQELSGKDFSKLMKVYVEGGILKNDVTV